jgi:hypothetical protein
VPIILVGFTAGIGYRVWKIMEELNMEEDNDYSREFGVSRESRDNDTPRTIARHTRHKTGISIGSGKAVSGGTVENFQATGE